MGLEGFVDPRPSGAGKSSFLRLLNRLDERTGGTVLLNDQDCRSIAPQELRRRVGMLMQTAREKAVHRSAGSSARFHLSISCT
jgi:ABC-type cobalamin/Fe3+-siderophores transport system ATPase subunit